MTVSQSESSSVSTLCSQVLRSMDGTCAMWSDQICKFIMVVELLLNILFQVQAPGSAGGVRGLMTGHSLMSMRLSLGTAVRGDPAIRHQ